MIEPIDVVIAWVDGNDPAWLTEKQCYENSGNGYGAADHRFRDWGTLRYLFRGIEKFMPWVRTTHLVTWGHLPEWLNKECPKLNIVLHKEFIPSEYLPTFNSNAIELNFHRIEGLANQFVYFNDDQFVLRPTQSKLFFKRGLPCDLAALNVHPYSLSRPVDLIQVRDVGVINEHYAFRKSIRSNWYKWLTPSVGKELVRTLPLLGCPRFPGFYQTHCAQSYLKSTFEEVWLAEPEVLDETCRHRFRQETDVNQWVMREWQLASGNFNPRGRRFTEPFFLNPKDPITDSTQVARAITESKHTLICINDVAMDDYTLIECKRIICEAFETILPETSSYEK